MTPMTSALVGLILSGLLSMWCHLRDRRRAFAIEATRKRDAAISRPDWAMIEALAEVDALAPQAPKLSPDSETQREAKHLAERQAEAVQARLTADQQAERYWWRGLVVEHFPKPDTFRLIHQLYGLTVSREWLEANRADVGGAAYDLHRAMQPWSGPRLVP